MKVFIIILITGFFLNLGWELWHSVLYTTPLSLTLPAYIKLVTNMALRDGFWISVFYEFSVLITRNKNPFKKRNQMSIFIVMCLVFSFGIETFSIQQARWKYAQNMPILLGVGITPLLQLAITGLIALGLVFYQKKPTQTPSI